eukprot:786075-Alexandrium_andersonii.AAC.1
MSASLVGSEMCIRDSRLSVNDGMTDTWAPNGIALPSGPALGNLRLYAVSYTHLTLPTICSV